MFEYRMRVYFQDTDAGGVVYHANYLNFAERARAEMLRAMGVPVAEMIARHNVMFMARRVEVDYLRPARLDDELIVVTRVGEVGGVRVKLRQTFQRDSDSLAVLDVWLVCVGLNGRPARLPREWRVAMAAAAEGWE